MSKTIEELQNQLDENIPRDVVSKRDAGGGKKLDYLEAWYVIDRMNQIFGALNWARETIEMRLLPGDRPAYTAKVRVTVCDRATNIQCVKEGFGFGNAKGSSQDHELAIKEAESDAFKRAAMQFGRSMGLALYDKTQEYVEDAKPTPKPTLVSTPLPASKPAVGSETAKVLIEEYFKTLKALSKIDANTFKQNYTAALGEGATCIKEYSDNAAKAVLAKLRSDFPVLK